MKFRFKFLLFLCVVFVGIYATTPVWLAQVLGKQLPPGWQLEELDSGYPGLSGIDINLLRVKGGLQAAGVTITASDISFTYQGLKSEVASVVVDVFFHADGKSVSENPTLNDLSLPITNLTGQLPDLTVNRLDLSLHSATDGLANQPLELQFEGLKLVPGADHGFHLNTGMSILEHPGNTGRIDIDVSTERLTAQASFPAIEGSEPWFHILLEQKSDELITATRVHAALNANLADQQWLDSILTRATGGVLTHFSGRLEAIANFAGRDEQQIESLFLNIENLQVTVAGLDLDLDAELIANREGERVTVLLPEPAEISNLDKANRIGSLLQSTIPELQRSNDGAARSDARLLTSIDTDSNFVLQTEANPSIGFAGNIKLDYLSPDTVVSLKAEGLDLELEDLSRFDSLSADGLLTFEWVENTPFTYTSGDLVLEADSLSVFNTGYMHLNDQFVEFEQAGRFEMKSANMQARLLANESWLELDSESYAMGGRLDFKLSKLDPDASAEFHFDGPVTAVKPVISLPGDVPSIPTVIEADKLTMTAELSSRGDRLVSTGNGAFLGIHVAPQSASASKVDIAWQDFDLLNMSGNLDTKTKGFSTQFEDEAWSGFDLDIAYSMLSNADINGAGTILFDAGPQLPIEFNGNSQTERWNITLLPVTFNLAQLSGLMGVANVELPATIKLADGTINLQGKVIADDEITAILNIGGHEMAASMRESSVNGVNFKFDTTYGANLSANGSVSVTSAILAGGVDVLDVGADLNLADLDTIGLHNLQANLFDGYLKLEHLQLLHNRIQDTTAELRHIDLGQLLAFFDINGLAGSGLLDISLPVGSDQTGVYIKNGTFNSTGPGHLAYKQQGVAASNIGLQALENFQYQGLSGTVDYQSDGMYRISVHIEGKNPDLYGGHPIVFNLNINGALPELFEGLFMTGDFDQSILDTLRTK
jgi:hypothetical protein